MDLEAVWKIREDDVYPALFGKDGCGIFPLSALTFSDPFGVADPDPRWLHYGVFEFAPTETRRSWAYVSSGHSNPWGVDPDDYDPAGHSGEGVEFMIETTVPGDWAIRTLQSMVAFDLLLAAGRFPGSEPLREGDRVPLRRPLDGTEACVLRYLVVTQTDDVNTRFSLPSGKVGLLGFTAVSEAELLIARSDGSDALMERLRAAGHSPVNDPKRASL